jgi:RNA polymerase sigma-70 factor (ECF subfamily)
VKTPDRSEEWIPTRQSLLTRLKDWRDDTSWRDFFSTYWRLIYGVAVKAGLSDAEAQEVVQETVIAVAKKMPEFKYDPVHGSFKAWLLTLTQWRISDQFRKRQQLAAHHPDLAAKTSLMEAVPDPASEDRLAQLWDDEWHKNLMEVALERVKPRVSPRTLQIFQLHVLREWPVEKVTRTLGVGRAQVYLAKHRVAALLKKEITRLKRQEM